jgi:serine/threonine protein kinase
MNNSQCVSNSPNDRNGACCETQQDAVEEEVSKLHIVSPSEEPVLVYRENKVMSLDYRSPPEVPALRGILSLSALDHAEMERTTNVTKDCFEKLKILGIGSFGKVTLVRKSSDQQLYAMKEIRKKGLTDRMRARICMERNVMALHRHSSIVKLHYAFQDSKKVYMVMDYCSGGDLYYNLHPSRRYSNKNGLAKFVISQVLMALGHLHSHGIIYRDLKPENILFDEDGYVKLADFGLSKGGILSPTTGATSICGSLHYLAPEVLLMPQRPAGSEYGWAADYWGLGILLYEILFGLPPWFASDKDEMVAKMKTKPLHISSKVPLNISDFIVRLLNKNPSQRLGSQGVEDVKSHPYFKDVSWEKLLNRQYAPCFKPSSEEEACNFDETYTRLPLESSIALKKQQSTDLEIETSSIIADFDYQ